MLHRKHRGRIPPLRVFVLPSTAQGCGTLTVGNMYDHTRGFRERGCRGANHWNKIRGYTIYHNFGSAPRASAGMRSRTIEAPVNTRVFAFENAYHWGPCSSNQEETDHPAKKGVNVANDCLHAFLLVLLMSLRVGFRLRSSMYCTMVLKVII